VGNIKMDLREKHFGAIWIEFIWLKEGVSGGLL
jgi:hypothetical protein